MAIAICAVLCGTRSYTAIAEWAKHRTQKQLNTLVVPGMTIKKDAIHHQVNQLSEGYCNQSMLKQLIRPYMDG